MRHGINTLIAREAKLEGELYRLRNKLGALRNELVIKAIGIFNKSGLGRFEVGLLHVPGHKQNAPVVEKGFYVYIHLSQNTLRVTVGGLKHRATGEYVRPGELSPADTKPLIDEIQRTLSSELGPGNYKVEVEVSASYYQASDSFRRHQITMEPDPKKRRQMNDDFYEKKRTSL